MKKKLFSLLLCLALILSVGVVAYAAAGGFTMTYLPGTSDTVANMPDADSGVGGQPYTVSDKIPQREGYEFLGWTLDYGVANTYTLNYQVTGDPTYGIPGDTATPDPVTGIRAGSNVTLANALDTAWKTKDGSPAPTTATYIINYLEKGTEKPLVPWPGWPDRIPGTVGQTITKNAVDVDGYMKLDPTQQTITLKPDVEGSWTFTGWCSDEACTSPISEVTNISADTTVYGKWVYTETTNENEITFCYEEMPVVEYTSYVVRYVDRDTGSNIADYKTVDNQKVGDRVTEEAVESDNYDLDDDSVKTLTLQNGENEIIFYYKPAVANYTVRYVDVTDGGYVDIRASENGTGYVGQKIIKTRLLLDGYKYIGTSTRASVTLSRNDDKNVIIFEYVRAYTLNYKVTGDPTYGFPGDTATPDPVTGIRAGSNVTLTNALSTTWVTSDGSPALTTETYKVNYLEQGTDRVLAMPKVVDNRTIGTTVTEHAIDIVGYTVKWADTQDLTIKQSTTGQWTFTGWCSDAACTQPITEVTNITADTTVYGKWKYEVIDLAKNEITFYYAVPTVQYTDYTVSYIDIEIGVQIIPDKVREHREIGSTQTELIPDIEGYMFVFPSGGEVASGGGTVTFKINEDDLIYDPITGKRIELYYQYI